jgi:hypothetical protein
LGLPIGIVDWDCRVSIEIADLAPVGQSAVSDPNHPMRNLNRHSAIKKSAICNRPSAIDFVSIDH